MQPNLALCLYSRVMAQLIICVVYCLVLVLWGCVCNVRMLLLDVCWMFNQPSKNLCCYVLKSSKFFIWCARLSRNNCSKSVFILSEKIPYGDDNTYK